MRQEILQVAVTGPDEDQVGKLLLQPPRRFHLARHADERVFRRQISVRRRIQRGPLQVRIVVGTSGGDIDQPNSKLLQQGQKANRLIQVRTRSARAG